MSTEKASALVLRTVDFSETSSVLTLFTREFGKSRALAKGARRPKGPFESALDLLCLCRIVFIRKSSDTLDLLTEAKLERRFRPAGGDLSSLYAAYYVAELLSEMTDDHDPHVELFDAADRTLIALSQAGSAEQATLRFEMTALRVLGHLPSLETCVECGKDVPLVGRVPFGQLMGGVLCASCRVGKKQVAQVSAAVLETMKRYAQSEMEAAGQVEFDGRGYGELRAVLNNYMTNLLGHPPRLMAYLGRK